MNHARTNKVWNRKGLQNVSGCVDIGIKNYSLRHLLQYNSVNRFRKLCGHYCGFSNLYSILIPINTFHFPAVKFPKSL